MFTALFLHSALIILHLMMELPGTECQATCFKNSSYMFSKSGRGCNQNREVCYSQGGNLVSIETEEEWKFIKHEIQKLGTWNTSAWHIGLWKISEVWIWQSGEKLNISKWRDSEPDGNDDYAEISKSGGLFNGISENDENAYICEIPGECQATCFKNSSYIFSKSEIKREMEWNNSRRVCNEQGFNLVSIETEEEWQFISNEIQKRGTWNASAWHIGLWKIGGVWTWLSGEQLNISKWRDSEPDGTDDYAEISKNGGLFNGISRNDKNAYICEIPGDSAPGQNSWQGSYQDYVGPPCTQRYASPSPSPPLLPSPSSSPLPLPSPSPSPSLSPTTPLSSFLRTVKELEAVGVFENFTINIANVAKDMPNTEEVKTLRKSIFEVAEAVENFALNYGKQHLSGMRLSKRIVSPKMVLAIQKAYRQNASYFHFEEQRWQARIDIASSNFEENGSLVVAFVYKNLHDLLLTDQPIRNETVNKRYINSRIMAITMDPKPNKLGENVILKFKNLKVLTAEKRCMFWSGSSKRSEGFSEEGCHVVTSKSNSEETVCSCNHLTHFAVLMDYDSSTKLTEEDETVLKVITYVGLSLSIVGILLTLILYSSLTDVRQPLPQIRLSVSMSLGAGQIIFIAGINATENKAACVTIAALMQYFFMAAFCWMLIEAIYLYFFVVKVYNINTKMHMYHVISWGLPVIMVVISLSIAAGKEGLQSYTSDKYCWLSSTNNLTWIFVAFVAFIEVLNILILVRVIKEITNLVQPIAEANHFQQIRLGIKACLVIIPLLGVTWLFGLLLPVHKAFAYIFTILNSTQGFLIFALHSLRNTQIKERFKRKMNIVFLSSIKDTSIRESSQVRPSEIDIVGTVELQSCAEFESKYRTT